jgi:hypothetical protein
MQIWAELRHELGGGLSPSLSPRVLFCLWQNRQNRPHIRPLPGALGSNPREAGLGNSKRHRNSSAQMILNGSRARPRSRMALRIAAAAGSAAASPMERWSPTASTSIDPVSKFHKSTQRTLPGRPDRLPVTGNPLGPARPSSKPVEGCSDRAPMEASISPLDRPGLHNRPAAPNATRTALFQT